MDNVPFFQIMLRNKNLRCSILWFAIIITVPIIRKKIIYVREFY